MKKLIVLTIILMATICWADTNEDIFKSLDIIDVSYVKEAERGTSFGVITTETDDFKMSVQELFRNNDNYFVLKPWTPVDNSFCTAFTDRKTIYVLCVDDKIVVLKEAR